MCILLYVKLIWCSGIPWIYSYLEEGTCVLCICAFCYMLNLFSVVIFHRSIVSRRRDCLSICTFCYMWKLFGVVVFHGSMVDWRGHTSALSISAFCYMFNLFSVVVFYQFMVNWRRGSSEFIWCSGIPQMYDQLEEEVSLSEGTTHLKMWQYQDDLM